MSKQQKVSDEELATLKGRTVIITGGASGIGLGAARLAHKSGANVTVADITEVSEELESEFKERTIFVKTDVTSWESVSNLFRVSHETFGSTDVVLANAGINLRDNLLEEDLDEQGKLKEPHLKNIDVNLRGVFYCTKLALFYFRKQPSTKCQLVMTGSVASLIETPPLYSYCASKAAVLGLMRGLRKSLTDTNITINMIAPWMTVTDMLPTWIREKWGDLPANDVTGVAAALLLPAVRPQTHGKTFFVGGNEAIEIEQAFDDLRPEWLGSDMAAAMAKGQKIMGIE